MSDRLQRVREILNEVDPPPLHPDDEARVFDGNQRLLRVTRFEDVLAQTKDEFAIAWSGLVAMVQDPDEHLC